jgi:hypothetical protein
MTKRIVFYLLLAFVSFFAFKSAYAQSAQYWGAGTGRFHESAEAACLDLFQQKVSSGWFDSNWSFLRAGPASPNGTRSCFAAYGTQTNLYGDATPLSCTPPKIFSPTAKTCVEPPPDTCSKGAKGSGTWAVPPPPGTNGPMQTGGCVDGCRVEMTGVTECRNKGGSYDSWASGSPTYCTFEYENTGSQCTAGPGSPGTVPPVGDPRTPQIPPQSPPPGSSCPKGTVQGGVDSAGTPICIGAGSDPQNKPPAPPKTESEKTEQKPDGSMVTTKTEVTSNSDGSTTTKTTTVTKAPDGSTKTDVKMETSNTPSGGKGKDESAKDDEKYDLCKQNPMLNICRNSSVSGTCGEVTCQGDAIQCATLRAAAAMECRTKKQEEDFLKRPEIAAGQQILDGNDPLKGEIDRALRGESVDFGTQSLDQSGFVGGGSCLAPRTFTFLGHSVTVSFDSMCSNIQPLRYAVLACAFIFAYLIVSRAALEA